MSAEIDQSKPSLQQCEAVIARWRAGFTESGEALRQIRDDRLYITVCKTFEQYLQQRWDLSRPHAYRLIEAAEMASALRVSIGDKNVPPPAIESHVRELRAGSGR